jgi:acetate kinase
MTKQSSQKSSYSSVLTVNGGSSSVKFALYEVGEPLKRKFYGIIDRAFGVSGTWVWHGQRREKFRHCVKIYSWLGTQ